jgi:myo-inositol-1(or 4)-monophosphatase
MQSPSTRDATELEHIALEVAREAANLVIQGFRGRHSVSLKAGNEPVTEFDLRSEEHIRSRLAELTPEIPVVGEELGNAGRNPTNEASPLTWYCDPIDGTVNFMRGHPYFAVSLGVARGGHPLAGAVVAPALGIEWYGTSHGSRRNGVVCQVSNTDRLDQAIVSVGSLEQVQPLVGRVRGFRLCGSAAIELCMVADGTYDVYWSPALNPWDICAGSAILLGAEGRWQRRGAPGPLTDLGCGPNLFEGLDALLPA